MLALERRGRHRSRRLLGWLSLRLLAVLLNASGLVSHFSYRSKTQSAIGGIGRAPFVTLCFGFTATGAPHIRAQSAKIKPNARGSTAEQFTDDFRRVVDHRHDAGVVEPGRPDDAENADDLSGCVMIGRNDGRGAGQRKQLVFRADKHAHALGLFGAAKQIDHLAPGFEIIEQQPHAFEISKRLEILEQMRLSPYDQLALLVLASRPARQTLGDNLLRELIELRFALLQRTLDLDLDLRQSVPSDPRVDEIRGFHERRGRQAGWNAENP